MLTPIPRENLSYTTTDGHDTKMDLASLVKLIEKVTPCPRIFCMEIAIKPSPMLPDNFILVSKPVGDAIEEALKRTPENP